VYGPSSITLALQLSGFNGQRFCFHGYLPREKELRLQALRQLEQQSKARRETEIWIETPYRNMEVLRDCLDVCKPDTWLCVAWDLCGPNQGIIVEKIATWRQQPAPEIHKIPAIFLLC
jgi:16S rRNA (cytidine1402-2'-O)-methyltransferase